jgi:hypothetical protein
MNQVEAKAAIIEHWLKRPASQRSEGHIAIFYGELVRAGSALLNFKGSDDQYQRVKTWLMPHVVE